MDHHNDTILELHDVAVQIERDRATYHPLNGATFKMRRGASIGLVGESGCGKTMTAYSILNLLPPGGKVSNGSIRYTTKEGRTIDLAQMNPRGREMRHIRGGEISMIFQEPMTAFSPVHTICNQIAEAIRLHTDIPEKKIRDRVIELLDLVGIPEPHTRCDAYPFQFSGGMRQRAMIAMALAPNPSCLIADEPTTALDVTIQAQVLALIKDLQKKMNLSLILITHDLGVIAHMVEHVNVMYAGRVIESAPVHRLFDAPAHPYTEDLLHSIPKLTGPREPLTYIKGSVPDTSEIPSGCPFHPRCRQIVGDICKREYPATAQIEKHHHANCFKYAEAKMEESVSHE